MSVLFRESTRKMTSKNKLLVLVLIIGCLDGITGAAFSNVVVQSGGVLPVEYINYNPSSLSFTNAQLARLSASPLETVLPVRSVSAVVRPCLSPCVISNAAGTGLAPITSTSNAKIIAYKPSAPSIPVVVTKKEAARGYQYAYAVFDDHTGDKKSQSEHSDGSLVQGQYSFIQPDGIRREVVYTADDLKGFNAIVRNISPEPEHSEEKKVEVIKGHVPPCPESQNEHLSEPHDAEKVSEEGHAEVEHTETPKKEDNSKKSGESSEEKSAEKEVENHKDNEDISHLDEAHDSVESAESSAPVTNNVISYDDIIKCLQTKLRGANSAVSPLTYVLIPSLTGPC